MNANLDNIAKELYGKIETRFSDIKIGDENAEVLSKKEDIPNARFFEFEYTEDGEPLGTIAITLDEEDGVVVQISGDLVNDDDHTSKHGAYKFLRSFRQFAKDRLLNFDIQNIGKSNLDKRDYEFQAKRKEEIPMDPIMENKLYGTSKLSYQDLGEARLIIKHSQPVNAELAAGRTMHIDSIYIENAQGERFKYPYKHINGARALAEHIKHGGNPYDAIGSHITSLSEELASLRKFKNYVGRQSQLSEAMANVTGRVAERIEEIKKTVQHLQRPSFYEEFAESFEVQEKQMVPEEVQNDLIDRLTIRTFNEELKAVFPFIARFVDESELPVLEVNADDIIGEADDEGPKSHQAKTTLKHLKKTSYSDKADAANIKPGVKGYRDRADMLKRAEEEGNLKDESFDPETTFENFMDNIVREDKDELFSPNKDAQRAAIEKLNQIMGTELKGGPEGINAIESLRGLIDDPEFLNSLRDIDSDLDVRPLVQQYVLATNPEVATQLHFGSDTAQSAETEVPVEPTPVEPETAAAPEAPVAPQEPVAAPAPEEPVPVAESDDKDPPWDVDPEDKPSKHVTPGKHGQGYSQARHLARQGMAKAIAKAKAAGASLDTKLDLGHKEITLHDAIRECGMVPQDFGFEETGLPAMLKFVSGFYSKEQGNFPLGGMRVKIKVKKAFEDGQFGEASPEELVKVLMFIDKKDPSGDVDGQHLQDIQRLAGTHSHAGKHEVPDFESQASSLQSTLESNNDTLARIIGLVRH